MPTAAQADKIIKPAPSLPPPSKKFGTHEGACIRNLEEGIQDTNSVQDIVDSSARPSCDDVLRQSFHSELLTPRISRRGTARIQIDRTRSWRDGPNLEEIQLSYDYNKRLLIVDTPSILHERFFDHLKDAMAAYFLFLPYDRELISPILSMNYSLKLRDRIVTPDLTMTLTAVDEAPKVVLVPCVGECGSSENRAHVFDKVDDEVIAHPEAVLAIIVLIREAIAYRSPEDISVASISLRNGRHNPEPLYLADFLQLRSTPRGFNQPIRIANHDWAHLASAEFFVWVKGANQARIDVRDTNPQFMAHGTLGSVLQMGTVSTMLQRGMDRIRDMMVQFSKTLDHTGDFSALEEADVRLPLNWSLTAKSALTVADLTAHERYESWHDVRFKGAKRTK
ncbi:uncharacterized protein EDB93DRAFT_1104317 [Suillus bovinus]|uniref:uncharacterized protein n=1 Tax=Suillus bovinus TaxID=48563 RepID=UPI001B87F49B|nr:uncharacterized protein EDB93DRAFT_1104317 [Suillus bovinus]KAG2146547.1 hypothetical protein EDB93DRAFT_1104317 [Suillus bovinus]